MSQPFHHIIGSAAQRQSAILVVEYLRDRLANPHSRYEREQIIYLTSRKMGSNDILSYEICVDDPQIGLDREEAFVDICRAFLVGCGDRPHVWG